MRSITTASVSSRVNTICFDWVMCSFSLTLLLFSLSEIMMSTSLLHMKQWAAWSCHLQLSQHLLKCFDIWQHFKKSVILHFWQSVQLLKINILWLWIRITLMYNSWWVFICYSVIWFCMNETLSLSRVRIIIVWEKWVYKASCC